MGKEGVGIQVRVRVSVLTAGLVYHKPPSCQYYDRSEMGYRELRSRDFRGRTTLGPQGRGRERDSLLVLRTSVGREGVVVGSRRSEGAWESRYGGGTVWEEEGKPSVREAKGHRSQGVRGTSGEWELRSQVQGVW